MFAGNVFVNVEVKGPRTAELKPKYDCDLMINGVLSLVDQYEMHGKFLFSSFSYDVLEAAERARARRRDTHPRFDIIYLYNYENQPLPSVEEYTSRGDGINISANHINDEVVANVKSKGLKLGVWIRAKDFKECEEFYDNMFKFKVDFICADFPLNAMLSRTKHYESIQNTDH